MPARKRPALADAVERMEAIKADNARPAAKSKPATAKRPKVSIEMPPEVAEQIRAACLCLPPLESGGFSGLIVRAVESELQRLQKAHNGGKPFDAGVNPRLRGGR